MNRYPLILNHHAIKRLMNHRTSVLIFARKLRLGRYEVHDSRILRRNDQVRKRGRMDLQEDPFALTVSIESQKPVQFENIDFPTLVRAGFKTTEEFHNDWTLRRRRVDDGTVYVHSFHVVDETRFLHVRVHRGYTSDPTLAVRGEPEALSHSDLTALARRRQKHDEEFVKRARQTIGIRAKQAAAVGDITAFAALQSELVAIGGTAGTLVPF